MKYVYFLLIIFTFFGCAKDKKNNPPSVTPTPLTITKPLGTAYATAECVYSKFTSDGNMLAVLKKSNNNRDLLKITPDGTTLWATTLGNESFYLGTIEELISETYMIFSSQKVYVLNKTGILLKELPLVIMDGYKNGSNIYLVNMDFCYQLDLNFTITDSFANTHNPPLGPFTNSSNQYTALFRNDGRIQYFYQDSLNSYKIRIITCTTTNSFLDSVTINSGFGFQTFQSTNDHVMITEGLWGGFGAPSFFYRINKYTTGAFQTDFSDTDYYHSYFSGAFTESSTNNLLYLTYRQQDLRTAAFKLNKSDPTQSFIASSMEIVADSITTTQAIYHCSNICGLVSQPGTDNVYLFTVGNGHPLFPGPQLLKINGTPEVIPF